MTTSVATMPDFIKGHDSFFARVINMIPKELYKAPDIDQVNANSKFYKVLD